jgi:hypothetical protein
MIYLENTDIKIPGATGVVDRKMIYESASGTVVD